MSDVYHVFGLSSILSLSLSFMYYQGVGGRRLLANIVPLLVIGHLSGPLHLAASWSSPDDDKDDYQGKGANDIMNQALHVSYPLLLVRC